MRKIIAVLVTTLLFVSCSADDSQDDFHFEVLPVHSYVVPSQFTLGETYPITINYLRPSTCHGFSGFYYDKSLNVRTIAIQSIVSNASSCTDLQNEIVEKSFNFHVTSNGSYIFKFWKGVDSNNQNIYEEVEVEVVE